MMHLLSIRHLCVATVFIKRNMMLQYSILGGSTMYNDRICNDSISMVGLTNCNTIAAIKGI